MNYFIAGVITVVLGAIFLGFSVIGSPLAQREKRFDETRIHHLQTIQSQLLYYWQKKGTLPETLSLLKDDISGFRVPLDPETGAPYEYRRVSEAAFQLCGTFKRESVAPMPMRPMIQPPYPEKSFGLGWEQWSHAAGPVCFDRTIDTELYRTLPEKR